MTHTQSNLVIDWVLCTTVRSGGHWFMHLLEEAGWGKGGEWWNPNITPVGVEVFHKSREFGESWGIKICQDELACSGYRLYDASPQHDRSVKFVYLYREDIIAQADSWAGAVKSGEWFTGHTTQGIVPGSHSGLVMNLKSQNKAWRRTLYGVPHLTITYEHLVKDPAEVLGRVDQWFRLD